MDLKNLKLKGGDKEMIKTKDKQEKGITLIALVVTIVVLLILAGVSINALFGNSGIIEKAKEAQNKMDKAVENDQEGINELNQWIDNQINGTTGEPTQSKGEIIKFKIQKASNKTEEYEAIEGMTWREWVNSEYSNSNFECIEEIDILMYNGGSISYNGKAVSLSEQIKSNTIYVQDSPSG